MRVGSILIFILILSLAIIGQTNKGSITGTVSDSKGLAVPGAKVTVTNVGTGKATVLMTSDEGSFTANALEPTIYDIKVESPNFKKALIQKVKVDTASVATINVVIEAGNISEEVTIQGDSQTVNSDSGTISQTITERQIRDLPLNNRSVLDLAVTMPNVSGDAGSEDVDAVSNQPVPGFNLSVNGGRPGSTSMLADGVNNTGIGIARAVVSFTPETVQEFAVQSSAYSAEYGTTGGGVINITTKSGNNRFSGTALWYHRNPKTNAPPWRQTFGTTPRPPNNLRTNQVSLSVGGPIYLPKFGDDGKWVYDGHNKSFFFFAYEPRWRTDFVSSTGLLPTSAERSGNFRGLTRTSSGFLPSAIAAQFGQSSIGQTGIYQQFTVGPGGKLVPIILTTGFGYCQFGAANVTLVANPTFGGVMQPQCTTAQIASETEANNPNLNIIPTSFFDPISTKLLGLMDPAGNYSVENALVRNYFLTRSVLQNETRYTLRLDHNITNNMKVNFRFSKTPAVGIKGAGGEINGNTGTYSDAKQYLVTINNVFSSSLVNDLRLNYTRGNFSEDFSPQFSIKSGRNYSRESGLTSLATGGIPLILLTQDTQGYVGADLGAGGSTNNFNVEQRKNISDTLYWNHGNQSWKFGADLSKAQLQVIPFFAASGGRWQFRAINTSNNRGVTTANGGNDLASFLIGVPNAQDFRPALFTYNYQWDSGALFAQNDWKIRPNFTLNLGLRYSLQKPRTEANNNQGVFRPDLAVSQTLTDAQRRIIAAGAGVQTIDPIPSYIPTTASVIPFAFAGRGGRSRYVVPMDKRAFEPRVGFAWSPKMKIFGMDIEKRSLVIRGGFGVSHFPINGNNRSANPDFGGFTTASTLSPTIAAPNASTGGVDNTSPIRFTGNNALQGSTVPLDTLLGTDANGLVFLSSLAIPGIAIDINDPTVGKVPYSESFNVAVQFVPFRNSTIEIAYAGNRGVHLYTPQVNISNRDYSTLSVLTANNINPATVNIVDPLGRKSLLGANLNIPLASAFATYLGFDPLNKFYNAKSSSIRHAAYIDFRRRVGRGINLTANYTFAKSIDDSSDASPDVRVLTTGSVRGQISLGGTLQNDRGLSSFDVRHVFNSTFTLDLPFGKGRRYLKDAPWYVTGPIAGWSVTGIMRIVGGNPYQPFLTDPNGIGSFLFNRVVRPDIVSGVALKNPLWDPKCRVGSAGGGNGGGCEPFLNPAAFMRPIKGQLGNAPRSLSIRAPFKQFLDLSIQKDFAMPFIGGEGKRKINFRVDALNVLNHPSFAWNNLGNTPFGMGSLPTEFSGNECIADPTQVLFTTCPTALTQQRSSAISAAEYDAWATFNSKPLSNTAAGAAALGAIRTTANSFRLPARAGQTSGALPDAFFHVALPQGFGSSNSLSYDITTLQGFKLYRLRQTYDGNFGTLAPVANNNRYLQFGIRLIF